MMEIEPTLPELQDLQDKVKSWNDELSNAGVNYSEQAFGISCGLMIAPVVLIMAIVFILGGRSWIALLLTALISALLALAGVVYLANQARHEAITQSYERVILPAILVYLQAHPVTIEQLHQTVQDVLPQSAPLRQLLVLPLPIPPLPPE